MGSIGSPRKITEQSVVLNQKDFIEYAIEAAAWDKASLVFVIDNINHYPKLSEILQNYTINFNDAMSAEKKLDRILELNSPLAANHVFMFKANICKGHNFHLTNIYISFCNTLFGGDINKCIADTLNMVVANEDSRLIILDSRQTPNFRKLEIIASDYLQIIPEYKVDIQIFNE